MTVMTQSVSINIIRSKIENILECSKNEMIRSLESFNIAFEFILMVSHTNARKYVQDIVFNISCIDYPDIAIFMIKNNLYTKETLTMLHNGTTNLHNVIRNGHLELVKCLDQYVEYFDELLMLKNDNGTYPMFCPHYSPRKNEILEYLLKSAHFTEQTLKLRLSTGTNLLYVTYEGTPSIEQETQATLILNSEKCTRDVIFDANGELPFGKICPTLFKLILNSKLLPDDYFLHDMGIFNRSERMIKLFLDSPYSNDEIIKKYLKNPLLCYNKHTTINHILSHPKFLHLAKNGVSNSYIETNDNLETHINELQCTIEQMSIENEILKLTVKKLELEKETVEMKKDS